MKKKTQVDKLISNVGPSKFSNARVEVTAVIVFRTLV